MFVEETALGAWGVCSRSASDVDGWDLRGEEIERWSTGDEVETGRATRSVSVSVLSRLVYYHGGLGFAKRDINRKLRRPFQLDRPGVWATLVLYQPDPDIWC